MNEIESKMKIRVASERDATSVDHVLQSSYGTLMKESYDAALLERVLPAMTKANPVLLSSGTYYVAICDTNIVACGGWTAQKPGTGEVVPKLGHIRHLATHPGWVRQGIGKAIYGMCECQAIAAGIDTFEVFASINAFPFYAAIGFDMVRKLEVAMGDGNLPIALMTKSLRAG
jgi:N-acetylglutamate synthase-like GNAT family acetyltransferase